MVRFSKGPLTNFLYRFRFALIGFWICFVLGFGIRAALIVQTSDTETPTFRYETDFARLLAIQQKNYGMANDGAPQPAQIDLGPCYVHTLHFVPWAQSRIQLWGRPREWRPRRERGSLDGGREKLAAQLSNWNPAVWRLCLHRLERPEPAFILLKSSSKTSSKLRVNESPRCCTRTP